MFQAAVTVGAASQTRPYYIAARAELQSLGQ